MRIVNVLEAAVPLSRYADPAIASGDLDTSVVAVITDVIRGGRPVVGLGYGSVGRYAQGGLIRARFAPRLLQAPDGACADASTGNLDPALAWRAMMAGEKPGGHGERCVAVGALDMAIWDAAAKIADEPLCRHIARRRAAPPARVPVYAGGGYLYPRDDEARLADEARPASRWGSTGSRSRSAARIWTPIAAASRRYWRGCPRTQAWRWMR